MNSDLQFLNEKLDRLERSNRRIKMGLTLTIVCFAALISIGAQQNSNKIVEAREFVLKDASGQMRAKLSSENSGPRLILYRASGDPAAFLDSDSLGVGGTAPHAGVFISTDSKTASVLVQSGKGRPVIDLAADSEGASALLEGKTEREHLLAAVGTTGPGLEILDQQGFETQLGVAKLKTIRTGESRTTSAASLVMYGSDHNVIWSAP